MSEITIRTATPDDAGMLLGIYKYYIENTAITYELEVPTADDFRGRIEKMLKKYPYIVAERDGKIIGYAYAGVFKDRAAYDHSVETSIYVALNEKRRGTGTLLYNDLEKTSKMLIEHGAEVNLHIIYNAVVPEMSAL